MGDGQLGRRSVLAWLAAIFLAVGCEGQVPRAPTLEAGGDLGTGELASLVDRISEAGGFFDTDNLISNETGYLNVMDALAATGLQGGAYVGVGPDQNFSYIAELRPEVAFIVDVRRDNLLHHLLLKALMERSPTRVEFLSALHGVAPPPDPEAWRERSVEEIVEHVDAAWSARAPKAGRGGGGIPPTGSSPSATRASPTDDPSSLAPELRDAITGFGVPLSQDDLATIARFHEAFVAAGPSLRFTSFGRPPRPYYPTYRQLVTETDVDGDRVSYLADAERYRVVRELQLANRIVPVVGDLAGAQALDEIGAVLREMGVELTAFYTSNVEFYLWRDRTVGAWIENVDGLPRHPDAVVIRSYFSNFGRGHPSAVRGYYATQILQPVSTLVDGGFDSYWELVTRDVLELR